MNMSIFCVIPTSRAVHVIFCLLASLLPVGVAFFVYIDTHDQIILWRNTVLLSRSIHFRVQLFRVRVFTVYNVQHTERPECVFYIILSNVKVCVCGTTGYQSSKVE